MNNDRIAGSLAAWLRRGMFVIALALAACGGGGGGGGGDGGSAGAGSSSGSPAGGGSGSPTSSTPPGAANAVTVTVAQGTSNVLNIPTVSVTVCVPGTSTCQTVDNVQVDTESFGLRLLSSALSSSMNGALPVSTAGNGGTLAECANFADGYMWGSVRTADVKIGGETASAIPLQVVGDLASTSVPTACQNLGSAEDTQTDIGANGILGIGVAPTDCDAACAADPANSGYYGCPSGANCTGTALTLAQTVANPVPHFATDNNGVILQMPAIGDGGAPSATGTLLFGIGTQSNNALSAAQRFGTNAAGDVNATFNGAPLVAFLDSGSNGLFFDDSSITPCTGAFAGFYCPASPLALSATLTGVDRSTGSVSFEVADAQTLYNTGNLAFDNLAGDFGSNAVLDLGLPFFYGKSVYYGYGSAPFVAF